MFLVIAISIVPVLLNGLLRQHLPDWQQHQPNQRSCYSKA